MAAPIGNDNATGPRVISSAVKRFFIQNPDKLRAIIAKMAKKAEDGDIQAFNSLADRAEGKAIQPIDSKINTKVIIQIQQFSAGDCLPTPLEQDYDLLPGPADEQDTVEQS